MEFSIQDMMSTIKTVPILRAGLDVLRVLTYTKESKFSDCCTEAFGGLHVKIVWFVLNSN